MVLFKKKEERKENYKIIARSIIRKTFLLFLRNISQVIAISLYICMYVYNFEICIFQSAKTTSIMYVFMNHIMIIILERDQLNIEFV